jgi:hypothetical protein
VPAIASSAWPSSRAAGPEVPVAFPGLLADDVTESPQAIVLGFAYDILKRRE